MRWPVLFSLLLAAPAAIAQEPVAIAVDGTMVVGDNVRVGGTATRGAAVSLHSGAGCKGDPIASADVEDGGRFTVAHTGSYEPPFTISVRASIRSRRSECVDLEIPAARQVTDEKKPPAPPPEKKKAEPAPEKKAAGMGMCIGVATRCGVLPKGVCTMQQGCSDPIGTGGFGNDRCVGTAKGCMYINGKNACMMQRGCVWSEGK
jgi:hypothetical protein